MHSKQVIETKDAPAAIGPYSQGIKANGMLFVSGQLPIDPATGSLVGDSVRDQTRQCIANIESILRSSGCTVRDIVKSSVFLTDLNDFGEMNDVYAAHFASDMPARVCVEVSRLPRKAKVEIEVIAVCGN